MTMFLRRRAENYVELFRNRNRQGTAGWLDDKKRTIGGSEMATLMGVNKYSSEQELVAQKAGLKKFAGSIKTRWGNMLEPVIQIYVEWDLDTKIIGDDISIPGIVKNQSYSPDGIGVVETEVKIEWLERVPDNEKGVDSIGREGSISYYRAEKTVIEPAIVLFEFKCPFNRLPNGKIPEYYLPQVKTGLDTIRDNFGQLRDTPTEADPRLISAPNEGIDECADDSMPTLADKTMCDYGIYIEAQFRKCAWHDIGNNPEYDRDSWPYDRILPRLPLAYGFVGFHIAPEYKELFDYFNSVVMESGLASGIATGLTTEIIKTIAENISQELNNINSSARATGTARAINAELLKYALPGREITPHNIVRVLEIYHSLSEMMRKEALDITPASRVDELNALPAGHIDRYCEFSDFGAIHADLLEELFVAFQAGIISPWYSEISYTTNPQYRSKESSLYPQYTDEEEQRNKVFDSIDEFINTCASSGSMNAKDIIGIFPWKLFRIDYHRVEKEIGYVDIWKDKISDVVAKVEKLLHIEDERKKIMAFAELYAGEL